MDLSKIYNHSVLYPRNKMAFETPLAPGGLHFSFGPSGVKICQHVINLEYIHLRGLLYSEIINMPQRVAD